MFVRYMVSCVILTIKRPLIVKNHYKPTVFFWRCTSTWRYGHKRGLVPGSCSYAGILGSFGCGQRQRHVSNVSLFFPTRVHLQDLHARDTRTQFKDRSLNCDEDVRNAGWTWEIKALEIVTLTSEYKLLEYNEVLGHCFCFVCWHFYESQWNQVEGKGLPPTSLECEWSF